jgi:hypothetical protein
MFLDHVCSPVGQVDGHEHPPLTSSRMLAQAVAKPQWCRKVVLSKSDNRLSWQVNSCHMGNDR